MNNFIDVAKKNLALYAVVKLTGNFGGENIYTMFDNAGNVLVWQTEKIIEKSDGNHYFLIEGIIKEQSEGLKQTVLTECDWELIDNLDKIQGGFYGKAGEIVELNNVTASFRKVYDTEWIVNGEFAVVAPESQYRSIITHKNYTFMLPYDSKQKITSKSVGKFNIKAKVIGYTVEKGVRTTFLCPILVEDKNGPFLGNSLPRGWRR